MYLTRVGLDLKKNKARAALKNPNKIHGTLSRIAGRGDRVLWRIDELGPHSCLTLLSPEKVDMTIICDQFGDAETVESGNYTPYLKKIKGGDRYHFRLKANPSKKIVENEHLYRRSLKERDEQIEWLQRKGEEQGFKLVPNTTRVKKSNWIAFEKPYGSGNLVRFLSVQYEGDLIVTDEEKFKDTLINGIGPEKCYGQGLMSIVPKKATKKTA